MTHQHFITLNSRHDLKSLKALARLAAGPAKYDRPGLSYVWLTVNDDGSVTSVATDSFAAGVLRFPAPKEFAEHCRRGEYLLDANTLRKIKTGKKAEEEHAVTVTTTNGNMYFAPNSLNQIVPLGEARFPTNIATVFPEKTEYSLTVNSKSLLQALRAVGPLVDHNQDEYPKMEVEDHVLTISTDAPFLSLELRVQLVEDTSDWPFVFGLNTDYLTKLVKCAAICPDATIELSGNGPCKVFQIRSPQNDSFTGALMPVHVT